MPAKVQWHLPPYSQIHLVYFTHFPPCLSFPGFVGGQHMILHISELLPLLPEKCMFPSHEFYLEDSVAAFGMEVLCWFLKIVSKWQYFNYILVLQKWNHLGTEIQKHSANTNSSIVRGQLSHYVSPHLFQQGKGGKRSFLVTGASSDFRKEWKEEYRSPIWNGVFKFPLPFICYCRSGPHHPRHTSEEFLRSAGILLAKQKFFFHPFPRIRKDLKRRGLKTFLLTSAVLC